MARLIWTEPTLRDLESVPEYISLDKPGAARAFVRKVFRSVEKLAQFPRSGRVPPEIPDLPYRELTISPCRVFYRLERETVYVVHVLRGERELTKEAFEEESG